MFMFDDDSREYERSGFSDYLLDAMNLLAMLGVAAAVIGLLLWLVPGAWSWFVWVTA